MSSASEYIDASNIVLSYESAQGPANITFGEIDQYIHQQLILSSVFGVRIGLATVCLPVTYLITKNKKTPIFALNLSCLVVLFIHSIMYMFTVHNSYSTVSTYFSGYTYFNQNASAVTAATNTFYFILITLVECSLTYQVYIIFRSPSSRVRLLGYFVTFISAVVGLVTIGFYLAYLILANEVNFFDILAVPEWLVNTPLFCFTGSSCITSILLILKLGLAIRTRRILGLKQFSIFHILFIMAFQTLIVPTVIIILSFHGVKSPYALSAIGLALVALSLPITTMWANSVLDGKLPSSSANTYIPYMANLKNRPAATTPQSSATLSGFDYAQKKEETHTASCLTSPGTLGDETNAEDPKFWRQVEMYADVLDPNDLEKEEDGTGEAEAESCNEATSPANSNPADKA